MAVVPGMTELTAPYWEAAREGRLVVQECRSCRRVWHPPLPRCPHCHAADPGWREASGDGTVYTYTVVRHPTHYAFAGEIPYVLAIVELAEGPRLVTAITGVAPDEVRVGQPVRAVFREVADGVTLPYFEPAAGPEAKDSRRLGMGLLEGKVAFVTGAARGQGRSHALRLAQEGCDIIALDACATPGWLSYPLATEADLAQTVKEVEALDRRIIARKADTRDLVAVEAVVAEGLAELGGRLDIVAANAAIISWPRDTWEIDPGEFRELVDVTLTGTFITVKAAVPAMIAARNGGSVILTSSGAAITAGKGLGDYKAAKAGVLALKDTLAYELAEHFIRVNAICPTAVDTPMIHNDALHRAFRPDLERPGREDVKAGFAEMNLLPIPWVDPVDISNAIVWLCSDAARYVTGVTLPVDAGNHLKC